MRSRVVSLMALGFLATSAAAVPIWAEPRPQMNPVVVEALAPLLRDWIEAARDAAIAAGVQPIPATIRARLAGYVPAPVLDRVRWRAASAEESSLQEDLLRFGDVPAVTLDYVIVFNDPHAALDDVTLWAHELKHVMQCAAWGIGGFATRYLQDYEAVEFEAAEFRWQFMKQAGLTPSPASDAAE